MQSTDHVNDDCSEEGPAIGIDLGTTYSVAAYLDNQGRPTTIVNDAGNLLTPSAVAFDSDTVVVGTEAVKSAVFDPGVFADCFKRDMGRRDFRREIANIRIPPEVLSAFVLRKLKQEAERQLGCAVKRAVITVPAFFDEGRRRATQEAGRLAGLEVLDIINEPTAAAVAFGHSRSIASSGAQDERIMVYDLGGGTFDVTVLEIDGQTFRTLATDGDVQLGGQDFDERLIDHVAQQFIAMHKVDPRSDPHDAAKLWADVRDAKHTLTQRSNAMVPCLHGGNRLRVDVSREEFEKMTADLLDRTETTTQLVLRQAKLTWDEIDRVLLVGGSTRMPMVADMILRVTGKEPDRTISPDESVAHGAALYAGLLTSVPGSTEGNAFTLVNVNSHSLGIIGLDQRNQCHRNVILIPKNTPLPYRKSKTFATARENQSSVRVVVVEGESELPESCITLGECVVRNLPPGLPKGAAVEVEYNYSSNGRLTVRARVPEARQSASVEIHYEGALHIPDLETWHRRVCRKEGLGEKLDELPSLEDELDRVMNRLDELLVAFGQKASALKLPSLFGESKATALSAAKALETATREFVACENQRQTAVGQSETLKAAASLAKASLTVQQAETSLRSARRHLARECINADYTPAELKDIYDEIKLLGAI